MSQRRPAKPRIEEAVILMAGSGSRLRKSGTEFLKPLIPIAGRPLISYTFESLVAIGVKRVIAVLGFEGETLRARLKPVRPREMELRFVENPEWQRPNGISLLAAKKSVARPFILTMGDHIFDRQVFDLLIARANPDQLSVAVDRRIASIFDLDDAMKVAVRGDRVVAIGKNLSKYNAIDVGLFLCPLEMFDYAEKLRSTESCSLANVVALMAAEEKARAIDIGGAWWHDVDTAEMLLNAERDLKLHLDAGTEKINRPEIAPRA